MKLFLRRYPTIKHDFTGRGDRKRPTGVRETTSPEFACTIIRDLDSFTKAG
jgi:hypothetical protein